MHKKILPNRNWCYFEQCEEVDSSIYTTVKTGFFHRCFASKNKTSPGRGQTQVGTHTLKVRLWLESGRKHREGRRFVSYDLLIPSLM